MNKKLIWILTLVSLQASSVSAQGVEYVDAVNKTVNPESVQQSVVLYQFLGWEVAVTVFAPLLVVFIFGWKTGLWNKDQYWQVLIGAGLTAVVGVLLFPFVLMLW